MAVEVHGTHDLNSPIGNEISAKILPILRINKEFANNAFAFSVRTFSVLAGFVLK